jgi:hypothetical protein
VLAAWAPSMREIDVTFDSDVHVSNLAGEPLSLAAGHPLTIKETPVLITGLPAALIQEARANKTKAYPWASDRARAPMVLAELKTANSENGIKQVNPDTTIANDEWRRTNFSRPDSEGHYVYFSVDPQFTPFGTRTLEITALVRRLAPDKVAGMSINYETEKGYVNSDYINIPEDDAWHELSRKVSDANFVGAWGWNFRLNAISSPNEFLIKEIKVRKPQQAICTIQRHCRPMRFRCFDLLLRDRPYPSRGNMVRSPATELSNDIKHANRHDIFKILLQGVAIGSGTANRI